MHSHEEILNEEQLDELKKLGYDRTDADQKKIWWQVAGVFGFVVFSWGITVLAYQFLVPGGARAPEQAVNAASMRIPPAPNPMLQSNATAAADMHVLRQNEMKHLTSVGYVDEAAGVVYIPIKDAIDDVATNGLPFGPAGSRVIPPAPVTPTEEISGADDVSAANDGAEDGQ